MLLEWPLDHFGHSLWKSRLMDNVLLQRRADPATGLFSTRSVGLGRRLGIGNCNGVLGPLTRYRFTAARLRFRRLFCFDRRGRRPLLTALPPS